MTQSKSTFPDLIAEYHPGFSLDADFYTSEEVYKNDLEKIFFCNWIYAGHASQLPEPGCYFLVEVGDESIIVVRDTDGNINAFANVCRHRGSRICNEVKGKVRVFVCPYHAWAYELNGRLRSKRAMPADFEQAKHGLKKVSCQVFHGLIFFNLDANPPDLVEGLSEVDSSYDIYELENSKVACQETYPVEANWKLVLENFMECYHCAPAHTEYSQCHALKSPEDNEALRPAMLEDAAALGYKTDSIDNSQSSTRGTVQYFYARNALYPPNVTGSKDGKPLAPLLGKIKEYGGGVADVQIGPLTYGILYPDHAVLYRFVPHGVQKTDMDIIWLVRGDAQEGKDYDTDELSWMWRVTTEADKKIIVDNQKGVNSRYYEPGCLSEMETYTVSFNQWYLAQIE